MSAPSRNLDTLTPLTADPQDEKTTSSPPTTSEAKAIVVTSTKPITSLADNQGEKIGRIPTLPPALAYSSPKRLFPFTQSNVFLVKQATFFSSPLNRLLALTAKRNHIFFQPALDERRLQQLLDAVATTDKNKVKEILVADPTLKLFTRPGTAKTSFGHTLYGDALDMAYSAGDKSIMRETGIANDKCDLLFMLDIPRESHLPTGELRAYISVKRYDSAKSSGFYFVERIKADSKPTIEEVKFKKNCREMTLLTELYSSAEYTHNIPEINGLTSEQLVIITKHTNHTYEEGIKETIERHFRTLPKGNEIIEARRAKRANPELVAEEKKRVAGDLAALDNVLSIVEKISHDECKIAHELDTKLQQQLFDHNKLCELSRSIQQATNPESFTAAFQKLNAYLPKSNLVKECRANKHPAAAIDILKAYLAEDPIALKKMNTFLKKEIKEESQNAEVAADPIPPLMQERVQVKQLIQSIHQAADEKHFDAAFNDLNNYLTQNKLLPEKKPESEQLVAIDLLKAIFQYRNHLEPRGIIRDGSSHANLHLLNAVAIKYDANYPRFGNDPWSAKNLFCYQKIMGYTIRAGADCDNLVCFQGVYWILNGDRLTRNPSNLVDSDSDWLLGYNCGSRAGRCRWPARGSGVGRAVERCGPLFKTYVEQKHRPEPLLRITPPAASWCVIM